MEFLLFILSVITKDLKTVCRDDFLSKHLICWLELTTKFIGEKERQVLLWQRCQDVKLAHLRHLPICEWLDTFLFTLIDNVVPTPTNAPDIRVH